MRAQVILLAGARGSGTSRLAERSGLPVLALSDFYREADDPALPEDAGWSDVRSWRVDDALAAIELLCLEGRADIPFYEMSVSRRVGSWDFDLADVPLFVAEGLFAPDLAEELAHRGLLADALALVVPGGPGPAAGAALAGCTPLQEDEALARMTALAARAGVGLRAEG